METMMRQRPLRIPSPFGVGLLWGVAGAALLVAACGPTVEQAKQVTTELRTESFTPPPRSVKDVVERLQAQATLPEVERLRTVAAQAPRAGAKNNELAVFHLRRGRAAYLTGRINQYLQDIRLADTHLEQATNIARTDARDILRELARAESRAGRFMASIDAIGRAARLQTRSVMNNIILADLLFQVGNYEEGRQAAGRSRGLFMERPNPEDLRAPYSGAMTEALAAGAAGQWVEAEVYWRKAIELYTLDFSPQAQRAIELGRSEDAERARFRLRIAEALRRQGRALEAEVQAREARQAMLAVFGPTNLETAEAVNLLARAILDQGRHTDAEELARTSLNLLQKIGTPTDAPVNGPVRLTLVKTLLPRREWARAGRELAALRDALGENGVIFDRSLALEADVPLALLKAGRAEQALDLAAASHQQLAAAFGASHPETAEMQAVRALALGAIGRHRDALAAFRQALPVLLAREAPPVGDVPTGQGADWRLPVLIEGYVGVLAQVAGTPVEREAGIDAAAEAFRVSDLARAGSVQRALTANAARAASRNPELADLARREQDAHQQSLALLGSLADTTLTRVTGEQAAEKKKAEEARTKRIAELKQQIEALTRARGALRAEIERRFPDYASLVNPKPVPLAEARAALRPGEVLVAFLVGDERTFVWAVSREGALAFASAPIGQRGLTELVTRLRNGVTLGGATVEDVPAFDVGAAHALYQALLAPVAPAWQSARTLVVAAHGPLGFLPLSVLVTARPSGQDLRQGVPFSNYRAIPWLARSHAMTSVPSVASLVSVRRLRPGDPVRQPFVGFGDPVFDRRPHASAGAARDVAARGIGPIAVRRLGPRGTVPGTPTLAEQLAGLSPLPDTADELLSIARSLGADPARDVFLGRDANEGRVKQMDLSRYRVIAFATHALVTGELEGLDEPGFALSAPGVAQVPGDGLLTLGEILPLRLDADWIVLSACNTAAGSGEGGEAVSGLGRAAFYAGGRALLVSHWAVESSSAKVLTTGVFQRQRDNPQLTRAEALRQTMLDLIDGPGVLDPGTGRPLYSLAHPLFWAPFALVGDGG